MAIRYAPSAGSLDWAKAIIFAPFFGALNTLLEAQCTFDWGASASAFGVGFVFCAFSGRKRRKPSRGASFTVISALPFFGADNPALGLKVCQRCHTGLNVASHVFGQ